jgi:hypothetical protein
MLPPPYTFSARNHGGKAFSVILKTQGVQTITASDVSGAVLPGTLQMTVGAALPQSVPSLTDFGKLAFAFCLLLAALWTIRKIL